jgi:aspartyl/glutamyl-tRNA(Asn/Gln) amidotransferase C subunit
MELLTRETILRIADTSKIALSDKEIETFGNEFKKMIAEIEAINYVYVDNDDILISPTNKKDTYRADIVSEMLTIEDVIKNAPTAKGNYIEVVRVVND